MDDNNYVLLRERLQKTKINYIDSNLLDLLPKLESSYDLINLTNIYEYINLTIKHEPDNEGLFNVLAKKYADLVRNLIAHLNKGGKMLVDYRFERGIKDLKNNKNEEFRYLNYLRNINIEPYEIEGSGVSSASLSNTDTDMVLIYAKNRK